jgi:hypothetical protein
MSDRAWHWTIGLIQLAIAAGVGGWIVEKVPNGTGGAAALIGFGAAYVLTLTPIKLFYWYMGRRIARDERSRKRF